MAVCLRACVCAQEQEQEREQGRDIASTYSGVHILTRTRTHAHTHTRTHNFAGRMCAPFQRNDLSRVLGWGPGYEGERIEPLLGSCLLAPATPFDRWDITYERGGKFADSGAKPPDWIMSNYFGIGIDAYIALQVSQCDPPRHSALFSVWSVLFKAFGLYYY